MEFLIIFAVLLGLIPAMVAQNKGRSFLPWWVYGSLLFIVALPHALLLKPGIKQVEQQQAAQGLKKCPYCAEMIKPDAKVCRYCGRDLPPAEQEKPEAASPPSWTCPSCGASIFAAQKYCDVCSPTIWKPATQSAGDASEAGVGTWHLIVDHRVAEERREALLTALPSLSIWVRQ